MTKLIYLQIYLIMFIFFFRIFINSIPSYNAKVHPLIICLLLIFLTIFNSINIRLLYYRHWYSYVIFLIIIGGIIIIFLYFTRFIRNIVIRINWNTLIKLPIKLFIITIIIIIVIINIQNFIPWNRFIFEVKYINNDNFTNIIFIINKNFNSITSILYLLICLTIIVKIIINKKLTLRKLN